jgi:NAD(P)-dependent dehydrogenase (short-subunit alcohol dehydrogenase family)
VTTEGKTAVITAGAHGIGRCVCERLAARGANVVIADIDAAAAVGLAQELGSPAVGMGCDVRSERDLAAVRDVALERFGTVDLLMNHAGVSVRGELEEVSIEDWTTLLDLNVLGMVRALRVFLPSMIEEGGGRVVFTTSSLALLSGNPVSALGVPYITSKAAIVGLAQSAAIYLEPHGISVTLFAPDYTDTAFARRSDEDRETSVASVVPYPPQQPEEAADVLMAALDRGAFLASATPRHSELLRLQADSLLDPGALSLEYNLPARPSA